MAWCPHFFLSGISSPYALAFDKKNNLYIGNYLQSTIGKILPKGTVNPFISSGIGQPTGLIFDEFGNLWVATWGGSFYKVSFLAQVTSNPMTFKVAQPGSSTKNLTICPSELP